MVFPPSAVRCSGKKILILRRCLIVPLFLFLFFNNLSAGAERISVIGEVLDINLSRNTLKLAHDSKGWLKSTKTLFNVSQADALIAQRFQRVRGEAIAFQSEYRLEHLYPFDPVTERTMGEINRLFRRDTLLRGRLVERRVGEPIPSFALYNQDGLLVRPANLKGRFLVINFIFTRCPDPSMCPAATLSMMDLQRAATQVGRKDLHLISVSFDPEYDSPGILKQYASARGIDNQNFDFLTGPPKVITDVMKQFGILRVRENGTWMHTMATVLVDPQGRILYRKEGKVWQAEDFLQKMVKS